jgi:Zn-dependent alcohol dehydrogenase
MRGPTDVPKNRRLVYERKDQIDPMITHVLKLWEINKRCDQMTRDCAASGCRETRGAYRAKSAASTT